MNLTAASEREEKIWLCVSLYEQVCLLTIRQFSANISCKSFHSYYSNLTIIEFLILVALCLTKLRLINWVPTKVCELINSSYRLMLKCRSFNPLWAPLLCRSKLSFVNNCILFAFMYIYVSLCIQMSFRVSVFIHCSLSAYIFVH